VSAAARQILDVFRVVAVAPTGDEHAVRIE
jgi:hypothetical protein